MTKTTCTTQRLRLRHFCLGDLDEAAVLFAHEDMACGAVWQGADRDNVAQWLQAIRESYNLRTYGLWAVVHADTCQMVGCCGIVGRQLDGKPVYELVCRINPLFRRHGYATEALQAVCEHAFGNGLKRLYAVIAVEDVVSAHIAERMGMTQERESVENGRAVRIFSLGTEDGDP